MTQPTARTSCRACGGALDTILNLGSLMLSGFPAPHEPERPRAPLHLVQCQAHGCGLVQLADTIDPERLFREYWYLSGINETMTAELADVVAQALLYRLPQVGEAVLDIGANDGTLLSGYPEGIDRIAVEPADNLQRDLSRHAEIVRHDFFPGDGSIARQFVGQIAICTSIGCFYDADDPHAFVAAVEACLAPGGIWVVQFQDLAQMVEATAFDNLVHEHLVYYSLGSFDRLIRRHGLWVVHAERRSINGGSLRLIVQRQGEAVPDETVVACVQLEADCDYWETLSKFSWRVGQVAKQIRAAISAAGEGPIDLYGASTKGNTLCQIVGLGPDRIRQVWERSPAKWGRETITGIPIVSEEVGRADPPALLVAGIWQFRDAVLAREAAYLQQGGRILLPLPVVELVEVART